MRMRRILPIFQRIYSELNFQPFSRFFFLSLCVCVPYKYLFQWLHIFSHSLSMTFGYGQFLRSETHVANDPFIFAIQFSCISIRLFWHIFQYLMSPLTLHCRHKRTNQFFPLSLFLSIFWRKLFFAIVMQLNTTPSWKMKKKTSKANNNNNNRE